MNGLQLVISTLALTFTACAAHAALLITPRSEWTSSTAEVEKALKQPEKIRLISIHQTESPETERSTVEGEKKRLRSILSGHTTGDSKHKGKGWADIAYHYIIGPSGTIYACRETRFQSDSATVFPEDLKGNITVCLMGDFRTQKEKGDNPTPDAIPTPAARESLRLLLTRLLKGNDLTTASVKAHRDLRMVKGGSDCPGGLFYPMIAKTILPAVDSSTPLNK